MFNTNYVPFSNAGRIHIQAGRVYCSPAKKRSMIPSLLRVHQSRAITVAGYVKCKVNIRRCLTGVSQYLGGCSHNGSISVAESLQQIIGRARQSISIIECAHILQYVVSGLNIA